MTINKKHTSYLLSVKVVAVLSKNFVDSTNISEGDEAESPAMSILVFSFSLPAVSSAPYLDRLVVGSFITITSAISPKLAKYSLSPSEIERLLIIIIVTIAGLGIVFILIGDSN